MNDQLKDLRDKVARLSEQGEWDASIAAWSEFIAQADKPRDKAEALLSRGRIGFARGDLDGALDDFNRAIELHPQNANAHVTRGVAHWHKGNTERAVADFERALEIDPNNADAHCNRGNVHAHNDETALAVKEYNRAIELAPEIATPYLNRAEARIKQGETESAYRDFFLAGVKDPNLRATHFMVHAAHQMAKIGERGREHADA